MPEADNNMITVIIPVCNEYGGIPFLVESLNEFFRPHREIEKEVIFVNDGSKDKSIERLMEMKQGGEPLLGKQNNYKGVSLVDVIYN